MPGRGHRSDHFSTEQDIELKGWEDEAVEQLAAHLVGLASRCSTSGRRRAHDWDDPLLGALRVRRYGGETTDVLRIDSVGEVFIRLNPDAVAGPLFQPAPDKEGW